MIKPIKPEDIPYDPLIRALCMTPHYNNPKGCSKRGVDEFCPPKVAMIDDFFDFETDLMYIITTSYEVGAFAERIRKNHPEWKEQTYPDSSLKAKAYVADITAKLKDKHPEWPEEFFPFDYGTWESRRGWYNPRQWQPQARKQHRINIEKFLTIQPKYSVDSNPEARGVNVTGLIAKNTCMEMNWQWPPPHHPDNRTIRVSIAGIRKE